MFTLVRSDYIAFGLYFEIYRGRNISKLSKQKIRLRLDSSFWVGQEVETVFGPNSRSRLELYSFQQRQLVRATSKAKGASDRRPTAKQLFSKPPYNLFNPAKVAPLPLLPPPPKLSFRRLPLLPTPVLHPLLSKEGATWGHNGF